MLRCCATEKYFTLGDYPVRVSGMKVYHTADETCILETPVCWGSNAAVRYTGGRDDCVGCVPMHCGLCCAVASACHMCEVWMLQLCTGYMISTCKPYISLHGALR